MQIGEVSILVGQMNVSVTDRLADFVRKKVRSGQYNSAREVVREALRRMEEEDARALRLAKPDFGFPLCKGSSGRGPLRDRVMPDCVSRGAQHDLLEIFTHGAERASPSLADRIIERVTARFKLLAEHPLAGKSASHIAAKVRCFPVGKYLVYCQKTRLPQRSRPKTFLPHEDLTAASNCKSIQINLGLILFGVRT
jgi:putative addiction module CopG family antidote